MKSKRFGFILSVAVLLTVLFSSTALVSADTINLPCTGQTTCYNSSGAEIACAGTGQDGDKKMGLGWPKSRFISNGGDCVWDTLTNLLWAKNADLPPGLKTWQEALDFVKSLNAGGGLCGQTGWRIPQISELQSLENSDKLDIVNSFINMHGLYWSSSTVASSTGSAWGVNMYFGSVFSLSKASSYYVWPVHDGL